MSIRGARILVSGSCQPAGRAAVETCLALGAHVVAADLLRTDLEQLRADLHQHDRLDVAELDPTHAPGVAALLRDMSRTSPIDAVVLIVGPLADPGGEGARQLRACVTLLHGALDGMRDAGRGRFVFLCTGAPTPGQAAVLRLVRAATAPRLGDRVCVNALRATQADPPTAALGEALLPLIDPAGVPATGTIVNLQPGTGPPTG